MESNLIKLPDIDGNMRHYYFCPSCYYWIDGADAGANYCPHCGIQFLEIRKSKRLSSNEL